MVAPFYVSISRLPWVFKNKFSFIYFWLFRGRLCCAGFSLVMVSGGYSLDVVCRLLVAAASLVAEHGL